MNVEGEGEIGRTGGGGSASTLHSWCGLITATTPAWSTPVADTSAKSDTPVYVAGISSTPDTPLATESI